MLIVFTGRDAIPLYSCQVAACFASQLKRFQGIVDSARLRNQRVGHRLIITDILPDVFGRDEYTEIGSEYAIRSIFCDLAIKIDGHLQILIEVKAIGIDLKDVHTRQAVDYAANQGVDWAVVTNGLMRSLLMESHQQRQATNPFCLAALLVSDPVLEVVRRELRRLCQWLRFNCPDLKPHLR
jgi:hypothetical protein